MHETSDNQIARLKALVELVKPHQRKMTDSEFCRKYKEYVGSTDVWKRRLIGGEIGELDVPKWIGKLTELLAYLEGGIVPDEFFCDDLPFNKRFQQGIKDLEAQGRTDRRIFCVLGAVGVGKTMSCKKAFSLALKTDDEAETNEDLPRRVLLIIPEALRENKVGLLQTIATALNCLPQESGAAALFDAIKSALSQAKVTLIFDEAHQGGVMLMRILKDLVNHTPASFVYVALQTEYMRVISASKGNIIEAKQFIRRCMQPVFMAYAHGTLACATVKKGGKDIEVPMDAAILLGKRAGISPKDAVEVAKDKLGNLRLHGNLSSLQDAIDTAQRKAHEAGQECVAEHIKSAIDQVCPAVVASR